MKAIMLMEEGRIQIVLNPETTFEHEIFNKLQYDNGARLKAWKVHFGEYYQCQGGWTRQSSNTSSMIFVCDSKPEEPER